MLTRTRTEVRSSHLRAFDLPRTEESARIALVPERAVLLADDQVTVSVYVGPKQALEIVEPGGTVAYAMRGRSARWDVRLEADAGARLRWHGQPFVVAEGADVTRTLTLDLAESAPAQVRDTVVMGRTGEGPGHLIARTVVHRSGRPILVEELDTALGLGPHRIVDQVLCLAVECAPDDLVWSGAERLELESGDHLHRWLGPSLHLSPMASRS